MCRHELQQVLIMTILCHVAGLVYALNQSLPLGYVNPMVAWLSIQLVGITLDDNRSELTLVVTVELRSTALRSTFVVVVFFVVAFFATEPVAEAFLATGAFFTAAFLGALGFITFFFCTEQIQDDQ